MFIRIFLPLLFILFLTPLAAFAQSTSPPKQLVTINSVKFLEVNYFESKFEVNVTFNSEHTSTYMGLTIDEISNGFKPIKLKKGTNSYTVYVHRSYKKSSSAPTHNVKVFAYNQEHQIIEQDFQISVNWPGPESLTAHYENSTQKVVFKHLSNVNVNLLNPIAEEIIESLIMNGVNPEKLKAFRFDLPPNNLKTLHVSGAIDSRELAHVFTALSGNLDTTWNVTITPSNESFSVSFGSAIVTATSKPLTKEFLSELKKTTISTEYVENFFNLESLSDNDRVQSLYHQAYTLIDTGYQNNYRIAKEKLDLILEINPDFPNTYIELARITMNTESWPLALSKSEKYLRIAKKLDPKLADTAVLLGYVYTQQGRFAEAEKEYKLAEKEGTSNLWLYSNWGLNYERQNLKDKALTMYLKVLNTESPLKRNKRPKAWVIQQSRFIELMISDKRYTETKDIVLKATNTLNLMPCVILINAEVDLFYLDQPTSALTFINAAREKGCENIGEYQAVAHYKIWESLKSDSTKKEEADLHYRRALVFSTDNALLIYSIMKSDSTSSIALEILSDANEIDQQNAEGMTALLYAIQANDLDATGRILQYGANPNLVTVNNYYAPLSFSVYMNNESMVKLLMKYDANPNIEVEPGVSLLSIAYANGNDNIIRLLEGKNTSI